jgi:eukaryotic-like serine/threonine-protein kinase
VPYNEGLVTDPMAVPSGTRLGAYEILSLLGAGGMGEVYRARDTRLGRDVALKVLPATFAADADRLRRFEQEGRAAASLNHPNIVTVFDVGTDNETPYVVSELLEGETLRGRLQGGALGVGRAVDYAVQVAHGLEAAHEKGIVHRDLKPENVFVTHDGRVKILDFGLAKLREEAAPPAAAGTISTTTADTVPGAMEGTLVYMSPEQLRAQPIDERTDIFAFGAILYEMLSGQRPFQSRTIPDTIAAILTKDPPDLALTNHDVPVGLNMIVRRALEKAPEQRFHSAHDLAFALEALRAARVETDFALADSSGIGRVSRRRLLAWALVASVVLLALVPVAILRVRARSAPPVVRLTVTLPDTFVSPHGLATQLAVSPDGKYVVFTAQAGDAAPRLWLRQFDSPTPRSIPGTDDATGPFWSPDSGHVAFFSGSNLKRVSVARGAVQTICDVAGATGAASSRESLGTWSGAGTILFGTGEPGQALFRVPAAGGDVVPATRLEHNEVSHARPEFLGDDRHFAYAVNAGARDSDVYVGELDGSARVLLKRGNGGPPRYVAPDHVVFVRERMLLTQLFDPKRFVLRGDPEVIADDLPVEGSGSGLFGVSQTGLLVYRTGSNPLSHLAWFDRTGRNLGIVGEPGILTMMGFSPDGLRVAYGRRDLSTGAQNIWVADLTRNISARLTFESTVDADAVWSPDGRQIAFASSRGGRKSLFAIPASGGPERLLLASTGPPLSMDAWSRDGRFILYHASPARDLLASPVGGEGKPFVVVKPRVGVVDEPAFSPDGRWVAYNADESGRHEIYVKPFPPTDAAWQISTAGGVQPRWRSDGREVFFLALDGTMMSVDIRGNEIIEAGQPRALFQTRVIVSSGVDQYAVTPDGQRFLVMQPFGEYRMMPLAAVLNWPSLMAR